MKKKKESHCFTHPIQTTPQSDNNEFTLCNQTYYNENLTHKYKNMLAAQI